MPIIPILFSCVANGTFSESYEKLQLRFILIVVVLFLYKVRNSLFFNLFSALLVSCIYLYLMLYSFIILHNINSCVI